MKIVQPSATILDADPYALRRIESAGRVCYKSEDRITDELSEAFVRMIIGRGHTAVLEHASICVHVVCDRGVSHELVCHRIGVAFCQESTRYCNYSSGKHGGEITVIEPCFLRRDSPSYDAWARACRTCEAVYLEMIAHGCTAQQARSVLPNSLKTEVRLTANIREMREIFRQRTDRAAHPQMRQIMCPLLAEARVTFPVVFDDVGDTQWP